MTTIMGLDLSYTGTGVALWRDGRVSVTTVRAPRRPDHDMNGWEWPRRQRRILGPLLDLCGRATPPLLVIKEARIQSLDVAGSSALDLAGLHAVVEYALAAKAVPMVHVNLTHVKCYASGKGNASKDWMRGQAIREMGRTIMVSNDDEADALWMLAMAVDRYSTGRLHDTTTRLTMSSPYRRGILEKLQWPPHFATGVPLAATPTASRRTEEEVRA